ncbi:hypothetical protein HRbin36_01567 [bacterium HR36]|nr:hypothetical protein HRbin36_01567 [bacterium HR36]
MHLQLLRSGRRGDQGGVVYRGNADRDSLSGCPAEGSITGRDSWRHNTVMLQVGNCYGQRVSTKVVRVEDVL